VKPRALAIAVAAAAGGLLAGILGGGSLPVAAAAAGTYTITTCSPGSSAGAWQPVNQAPASMTAGNLCGNGTPAIGPNNQITETGALFSEDLIGSTTPVPNGDEAGWQLTVPAGVTITGISYYSSYETDGDGWLSGLLIDGAPVASDCETNLSQTSPCSVLNDQVAQVQSGLNASSLFFGTICDQVGGGTRCAPAPSGSHNAEADLYSAQVTLVESGGPLVQGEGGALWGSGPVWGNATLTFDASDPSGIQTVQVQTPAGGNLAIVQQSCDFSQVQACPELPSGQVQVNTLGLPDGSEHVSLKLTNAAGDTTVVQGPTLVIDNNGPPAPSSLTAVAVSSTSDAIDLSWADPANPPEPVQYAYAQLCETSCQAPVPVSTSGGAQITAPAAGTYTVRVWLTDIEGRGSAASAATASVTVPAQPITTTTTTSTTTSTTPLPTCKPAAKCPVFKVTSATWAKNRLKLTFAKLPKGDRLQITIYYAHKPKRTVTTTKSKLTVTTARPKRLLLRALHGKRQQGATVTVTKLPSATGRG
jgi:hypothetical protein